MEMMFENVFNNLNFVYIFVCNIVTYLIIKAIPKDLTTIWKRMISAVVAVLLGLAGIFWLGYDKEAIFCSFFVQFLMYDYVIKWIVNKCDMSDKADVVAGDELTESGKKSIG